MAVAEKVLIASSSGTTPKTVTTSSNNSTKEASTIINITVNNEVKNDTTTKNEDSEGIKTNENKGNKTDKKDDLNKIEVLSSTKVDKEAEAIAKYRKFLLEFLKAGKVKPLNPIHLIYILGFLTAVVMSLSLIQVLKGIRESSEIDINTGLLPLVLSLGLYFYLGFIGMKRLIAAHRRKAAVWKKFYLY